MPAERILRLQGYRAATPVRPAIRQAAQAAGERIRALAAPTVAYRIAPILARDGAAIEMPSGIRLHCAAFPRTLDGCTEIVAFVLTLGPRVDPAIAEANATGDALGALFGDSAAWLCLEAATRQFQRHLRERMAARCRRVTSRLAPGCDYRVGGQTCTFALTEQRSLFALFAGAALPVALLDSCAMLPRMSRSGVIGAAPLPGGPRNRGQSPISD